MLIFCWYDCDIHQLETTEATAEANGNIYRHFGIKNYIFNLHYIFMKCKHYRQRQISQVITNENYELLGNRANQSRS